MAHLAALHTSTVLALVETAENVLLAALKADACAITVANLAAEESYAIVAAADGVVDVIVEKHQRDAAKKAAFDAATIASSASQSLQEVHKMLHPIQMQIRETRINNIRELGKAKIKVQSVCVLFTADDLVTLSSVFHLLTLCCCIHFAGTDRSNPAESAGVDGRGGKWHRL
jgi:hypothetical protein